MRGNLQNLTHWKPGQSGNPKGKIPGTRPFKIILRQFLEKNIDMKDPFTKEMAQFTAKEAVAMKLIGEAMRGNIMAIKEIRDMVDGPIKQSIEIEDKTELRPVSERAKDLSKRLYNLGADATPKKSKRKKTG